MLISKLSDLRNHSGHYDIFHAEEDWLMNPLAIVNIDSELYKSPNGFVSDVTTDVGESGAMTVRVKVRQPTKKVPTLNEMIVGELDVIYIYDKEGNYSHSEILNRFALIKEGVDAGEIEMDFYGVPVYEQNPDLMRVRQEDLDWEGNPLIARLTLPESEFNLPLEEKLESRIVGLLKRQ